jgi:hypothetical protein
MASKNSASGLTSLLQASRKDYRTVLEELGHFKEASQSHFTEELVKTLHTIFPSAKQLIKKNNCANAEKSGKKHFKSVNRFHG